MIVAYGTKGKTKSKRHVMSPKSLLCDDVLSLPCVLFIVTHPTSLFNSFAMQKPFTTTIHTTYETKNKCPFFVIVVHSMTDVEKKIVNFYILLLSLQFLLGTGIFMWFKLRSTKVELRQKSMLKSIYS